MADAAALLALTGVRRGELLALRWRDVDERLGQITVAFALCDGGPGVGIICKETKRADWREVPLNRAASAALARQRDRSEAAPAEAFIFGELGDRRRPVRPDDLTQRWQACRGVSPITLQHLRHFAATSMLDAGESFRTVADVLGNSEATLRLHYDGRTDVGKRQAVEAIDF